MILPITEAIVKPKQATINSHGELSREGVYAQYRQAAWCRMNLKRTPASYTALTYDTATPIRTAHYDGHTAINSSIGESVGIRV